MRVLIFDSGIGGLSVLREAQVLLPYCNFIYVADDASFPYGDWEEDALCQRMIGLFGPLLEKWQPDVVVIACNTASTIGIATLRDAYPDQLFVGTVPAIKPAAERTHSGLVSVLATPGTVERQYTRDLINSFASQCEVNLVGSSKLARLAEVYLRGGYTDEQAVAKEIFPCFIEQDGKRTDIVVLACTHYPFLANRMRKMAPWPVDWIDTSEAIARRTLDLLQTHKKDEIEHDEKALMEKSLSRQRNIAYFSSQQVNPTTIQLLAGFGLALESAMT